MQVTAGRCFRSWGFRHGLLGRPLVLVCLLSGCGLRTDPLDFDVSLVDDPGDDSGPARTCEDPGALPTVSSAVESVLHGASRLRGSCGDDEGPEAVYRFRSPRAADVTLRFHEPSGPAADLTVRVSRGACNDEASEILCTRAVELDGDGLPPHFFARPGEDYFIVVDSAEATSEPLGYAFEVDLEPPEIDLCPVHDTEIEPLYGSVFLWNHEFDAGWGRVDGACGGAGREHMFRVDVRELGTMYAVAWGDDGFAPVLNVRSGCGGTTEFDCHAGSRRDPAELWFEFPREGVYYLVIDGLTEEGGRYDLEVQFF